MAAYQLYDTGPVSYTHLTNEPEFEDNIILEKGEVLTSLYEKMNSARSINTIKAVHQMCIRDR